MIVGLDFHKQIMGSALPSISVLTSPQVQVFGKTAIISYKRCIEVRNISHLVNAHSLELFRAVMVLLLSLRSPGCGNYLKINGRWFTSIEVPFMHMKNRN